MDRLMIISISSAVKETSSGRNRGLSGQQAVIHGKNAGVLKPTVKWHTTNIYGKLGVRGRTQAVALARKLKMIP